MVDQEKLTVAFKKGFKQALKEARISQADLETYVRQSQQRVQGRPPQEVKPPGFRERKGKESAHPATDSKPKKKKRVSITHPDELVSVYRAQAESQYITDRAPKVKRMAWYGAGLVAAMFVTLAALKLLVVALKVLVWLAVPLAILAILGHMKHIREKEKRVESIFEDLYQEALDDYGHKLVDSSQSVEELYGHLPKILDPASEELVVLDFGEEPQEEDLAKIKEEVKTHLATAHRYS